MDIHDFAAIVRLMPHIVETIISYLGIADVANCLKTSKSMRSMLSGCIQGNARLFNELKDTGLRQILHHGPWQKMASVSLDGVSRKGPEYRRERFFGLGDWIFLSCFENGVSIHNVRSGHGEVLSEPDARNDYTRAKILSEDRLRIEADYKVAILRLKQRKSRGGSQAELEASDREDWQMQTTYYYEHRRTYPLCSAYDETLTNDKISSIFFFDERGKPMSDSAILLPDEPDDPADIMKQGNLVLVAHEASLTLYNATTGSLLWRTPLQDPLESPPLLFLTDIFCGYFRQEITEEVNCCEVLIFDSTTGQFISKHTCFSGEPRYMSSYGYECITDDCVSANGEFLCISRGHPTFLPDTEDSMSPIFFARVWRDPQGHCQAKCGQLHLQSLFAHKWMSEHAESFESCSQDENASNAASVRILKLSLLEFVTDTTISASLHLNYYAGDKPLSGLVALALVDLEQAADFTEPARAFASTTVPLQTKHSDWLVIKEEESDIAIFDWLKPHEGEWLGPYFRADEEANSEVKMAGVVVVDTAVEPFKATVYTFDHVVFEILDLERKPESSGCETRKSTKGSLLGVTVKPKYLRRY